MAGEKYVPEGVWLSCQQGEIPKPLIVTSSEIHLATLFEEHYATEFDKIPLVNIGPFGVCALTSSPCVPVISPDGWQPVQEDVILGGFKAIRDDSKCKCTVGSGAEIKISFDGSGFTKGLHKVSEGLSWISIGAAIGGCVAVLAAPFTGGGSLLLAAALFEVAEGAFVLSVGADAAAFVVQPSKRNLVIVGADVAAWGVGKLLGKYVLGPLIKRISGKLAPRLSSLASSSSSTSSRLKVSQTTMRKILWGKRVTPTNRIVGGHSPKITNYHPRYAVEELGSSAINPSCRRIKFYTQFPDGNLSTLKTSTIFPDNWSKIDIKNAIESIANNPATTTITGTRGVFEGTYKGVEMIVTTENGIITAGYPK